MSCYFEHAVLPDIVRKKQKHFVKFNRKEKKILSGPSSWSLLKRAILGKYWNLNFPVQSNGCIEIITAFYPQGFLGIVHRAINCTTPSPLFLTLQFLNFYLATPLLGLVLESCLMCGTQLVHKRSLAGLHSSSLPSPPTKSILPTVWHSCPSSHTYTYSFENVSFGIWLLQNKNTSEGDKNEIRGREAEKLEMGGKKLGGIFLVPLSFPIFLEHIPLLSSPLLQALCLGALAQPKVVMSFYRLLHPHCLVSQTLCLSDCWMGKRRKDRIGIFLPSPLGAQKRNIGNAVFFLSV